MKLPSAADRANLRLDSAAQRLFWATTQLLGAAAPSPAVKATATRPSQPAKAGIDPNITKKWSGVHWNVGEIREEWLKGYNCTVGMPLNMSLVARGCELRDCVYSLVPDTVSCEPLVNMSTVGDPIPDNSTADTLESYIVEQWDLLRIDRDNNPRTVAQYSFYPHVVWSNENWGWGNSWETSAYTGISFPFLTLRYTVLKKPTASNYDKSMAVHGTTYNPYSISSYADYPVA